jgi:XTP/dITP diphosphohydrolase
MRRLLVATTNPGKQREFRQLLAALPAEVVVPADVGVDLEVEEPHDTYADNAGAKAQAYAAASGLLTVADDSGIEVAALDWGPGVRSARWAGGRQADAVLEALDGVADRRARMVCALAIADPNGGAPTTEVFVGTVEGHIATERRGSGGFGYDPVFVLDDGRTTAELPDGEKNRVSHRGRAVELATPRLRQLLAGGGGGAA